MTIKISHEIKRGCLLVSEPFLPDPHFKRTVILITGYENEGTIGFVLNKPSSLYLNEALKQHQLPAQRLWSGGPVQPDTLQWIHPYPQLEGSVEIMEKVFWGGDFDQLKEGLNSGSMNPAALRFYMGYSGWSPGQLEEEISEGSWLITESSARIVFNTLRDQNELWKKIMTQLGGDYALLANAPENPWLN